MNTLLNVNLETQTAPKVRESNHVEWVEYGTEDFKNTYPQFLIDLYYNSSTHAAIINATAEMIAGEDIECEEEDNYDLAVYVKLKKFLRSANPKETLHEVIKKIAFDFKLQGGYAINIVWSKDRKSIAEIYHIPVEKLRSGKPDELGKICEYFISSDWNNLREHPPLPVAAFDPENIESPNQILYTGRYSPNMDIYHVPDYVGGCNWALIDQNIAEFHLNNIQNGFAGSYFISFANGVPTQEERFAIEKSLTQKFTGTQASGRFVLTFSEDKTRVPEITPIAVSNADKQYLALQELMTQNILVSHRVTSPMLMGIKNDTGLGNNADELNSAFEVYLNTVVKPYQEHILKTMDRIMDINNMYLPLHFIQAKPITSRFTMDDMKAVMTQDEIREELGLAPLLEEEDIAEDEYQKMQEHIELDKFITEFGEDIDEGYELIDEEVVDGEHQAFDFESVMNEKVAEQLDLASTGIARPNARTRDRVGTKDNVDKQGEAINQDGIADDFNAYFKVRYVYTKDASLQNKSGNRREFCTKMINAKKVYRKQDIINMGGMEVNPGFGIGGANTYSIWLYKGGPQCFHFWKRQIYQQTIQGARKNIKSSQIVTYAKARSEGFTAEKNDGLVSTPPRKMINRGYNN